MLRKPTGILVVLLVLFVVSESFAVPPYYQKRDTWFESMLASHEALLEAEASGERPGPKVCVSKPIRGGADHPLLINVPTEGVDTLYLYVFGDPEIVHGALTWGDPQIKTSDGRTIRVCDNDNHSVHYGRFDLDRNMKAGVSGPLYIAGEHFEHGIQIYAPGKIEVPLPEDAELFTTRVGIGDWIGDHGTVRVYIVDAAGAARLDLWRQLETDFPEERPRLEMKRERVSQVWGPFAYLNETSLYQLLTHGYLINDRWSIIAQSVSELTKDAITQGYRDLLGAVVFEDITKEDLIALHEAFQRFQDYEGAYRTSDASMWYSEPDSINRPLNLHGLRDAIEDLKATHDDAYPNADAYLERLRAIEDELRSTVGGLDFAFHNERGPDEEDYKRAPGQLARILELNLEFKSLQREALLANPAIDFDRLLLIRRTPHGDPRRSQGGGYGVGEHIGTPRQSSKCNPGIEQPMSWENDIVTLAMNDLDAPLESVYHSEDDRLMNDIDLHWDGDKVAFAMPGDHDKWHVFEMGIDAETGRLTSEPEQLTPGEHPDVHFYDPCYLPDDRIAMVSTAPLQGVPCNTGVIVGMMYRMNADGSDVRQLAFEQDHTYCPSVLNDGRILYLRWDYTDTPHVWNRILCAMNPDGTAQQAFYGSNSYWPNSVFFSRAVPGSRSKFVGIVTGHHVGRVGELVLFDAFKGQHEADGVVQRIPGRHEVVEPLIEDKLTEHSWPKFTHPYPISDKHFIVAAKPTPDSLWGIYLVDTFDNMVLLRQEERRVLLEPIPLRANERPPAMADRTDMTQDEATIFLSDIYAGPGLANVPRGSVKKLRIFTYHFAYQKQAGITHRIGADGPWEVKRVLGTVPVEADGSASFLIPANTPISIQPLDAEGKALQLMRSWMTAMPGEMLSCVGCHEQRAMSPLSSATLSIAARRPPSEIEPWYGPSRGFSFRTEVQPVLDRYCIGCHDGEQADDADVALVNLSVQPNMFWGYKNGNPDMVFVDGKSQSELIGTYNGIFDPSYVALKKYVRTGGLESDLHLQPPMEFYAETSDLIRILREGHHGVRMNEEAWDRLITWIDLNTPSAGTWSEFVSINGDQRERRTELRELYGGVVEDGEVIIKGDPPFGGDTSYVAPLEENAVADAVRAARTVDSSFIEIPARREAALSPNFRVGNPIRAIGIAEGVALELTWVPDSIEATGSNIWMGVHEVTNEQYAQFDPTHDSRFEHRTSWIFSEEYLGWLLNGPKQPVVRVSCDEAVAFCEWLTEKTGGRTVRLPTEEEWEYACRAGTETPFWFGDESTDFSLFANMGDASLRKLATEAWRPTPPDIVARDDRFDDGSLVTSSASGTYRANPWGLRDMHGNVAEWTSSEYEMSVPMIGVDEPDDGEAAADIGYHTVRGGSWRDLPSRCTSDARFGYRPYQKAYNVGFRVVVEN
jgi:formylglycine-generating enzyme required for sulfatase activity